LVFASGLVNSSIAVDVGEGVDFAEKRQMQIVRIEVRVGLSRKSFQCFGVYKKVGQSREYRAENS
jgi:hypothetical protein